MSEHCPFNLEEAEASIPSDPYHTHKGAERRISDPNFELDPKHPHPETVIVAYAAQEMLTKPDTAEDILVTAREVYCMYRFGTESVDPQSLSRKEKRSILKVERMAVWAAYWHLLAVEVARGGLSAIQGEETLLRNYDEYPWQEVDDKDSAFKSYTPSENDKLFMHTLRTSLFEADNTLMNRIKDENDPYHQYYPLLSPMDKTLRAVIGSSTEEGKYTTYTATAGSVALMNLKAYMETSRINENPYTYARFDAEHARLSLRASGEVVPFRVVDMKNNSIPLNEEGVPRHKKEHEDMLANGELGICIGQFPLVSTFEDSRKLLDAFFLAAEERGARGPGFEKAMRKPGSGALTEVFAIITAQVTQELESQHNA